MKQAEEKRDQVEQERNALMDENKNIHEQHDRLKLLAESVSSSIRKGTKKQPTSTSSEEDPKKKQVCCCFVSSIYDCFCVLF